MTLFGFILPLVIVSSCTCESLNININSFHLRQLLIQSTISLTYSVKLFYHVENNSLCFPIFSQKLLYPSSVTRSHKRYRRQFVMYHNFMTRASDTRTNLTSIRTHPLIYRNLAEDKLKQIDQSYSFNENSPNGVRNRRSSAMRMQPLNGALSKKKHILQYINNPSIYAIFTKPINQHIIPHPTTKSTYIPNTMAPSDYINSQTVTTLKPITESHEHYAQWSTNVYKNYDVMDKFLQSLDRFEREFYKVSL